MADMRTQGLVIPRAAARLVVLLLLATATAFLPNAGFAASARAIGDTVVGSDVTGTVSVTVSPRILIFGAQAVGTTSIPQTASVVSSGPFQMERGSPSLGGPNPGDFVLQGAACSITDPATTEACSYSVAFTPAGGGLRFATLSFSNNAPDSPQMIVLAGLGVGDSPTP